jgi:ribosomal protein L23
MVIKHSIVSKKAANFGTIIRHPLVSEKAVDLIEKQNTLMFSVDEKATKGDIAKEVEALYNVKVDSVRTLKSRTKGKRAFVRLEKGSSASDLATKLNIM